uniref:Uncharacterized protein n=1 Tax=Myotis myotis TaxID=51298 RepID=A0A7J7Z5L2_MYOMY|nr:hypothetical protein mMyoMyo1_010786 [Myotis myotis]
MTAACAQGLRALRHPRGPGGGAWHWSMVHCQLCPQAAAELGETRSEATGHRRGPAHPQLPGESPPRRPRLVDVNRFHLRSRTRVGARRTPGIGQAPGPRPQLAPFPALEEMKAGERPICRLDVRPETRSRTQEPGRRCGSGNVKPAEELPELT